jgi:hypothetical protein
VRRLSRRIFFLDDFSNGIFSVSCVRYQVS